MVREFSEDFYRSVYEHSMDAVLLAGPDGRVLTANQAACQLFKRTEEEICKIGRAGLVDADPENIAAFIMERERTGRTRGELVYVRSDGTRFPGEFSSVVFEHGGAELRSVVTIRDISEAKKAAKLQEELLAQITHEAAEIEAILESQEDVILLYDPGMNVSRANSSFRSHYGFDPIGINVAEIIRRVCCRYLDGRPLILGEQPTPRSIRGERVGNIQYRVTKANKKEAIVETTSSPLYVGGEISGTVTVWHDITELKSREEALRKSSEEIEDLYNHAPCGYHSLDRNGFFLRINDTELSWLGYKREEVVGKMNWKDIITPACFDVLKDNFPLFLKQGYVRDLEYEMLRKDGTTFTGLVNATAVCDADGNYLHSRGMIIDITERKRLEANLEKQARIDSLTGLNNRRYFYELLQHELSRSERFGSSLSLLMIDIDHFKRFNDIYGHNAGDSILKEMGIICLHAMREVDIIGRIGGEEFAAVLPGLDLPLAVEAAERLRIVISDSVVELSGGETVHFTVSIGAACLVDRDESIGALLKRADNALYEAKRDRRNCVRYQNPGIPCLHT